MSQNTTPVQLLAVAVAAVASTTSGISPTGPREALRAWGIETEVEELIRNNWPPRRIQVYLEEYLHLDPPPPLALLSAFALTVPPAERLPRAGLDSLRLAAGAEIEVRIDTVQELQQLLRLQSQRVAEARNMESIASDDDPSTIEGKRLSGLTSQLIMDYNTMLLDMTKLLQSLGRLNKRPEESLNVQVRMAQGGGVPTLQDLVAQRGTIHAVNGNVGQVLERRSAEPEPEPEHDDSGGTRAVLAGAPLAE